MLRFLFLMIAFLFIAGASVYILFFRETQEAPILFAYDKNDPVFGVGKMRFTDDIAPSFATDLCVASEDISLDGLNISAAAGAIFDVAAKEVTYAKGLHEKFYPASITKIMTTLVALKYGNLDDVVTVGEECKDIEFGSSVCEIHVGDRLTLRQLLYGLMINSGNDASMTVAVHIGGTVENFVVMMNEEASRIGATNTHFTNPHGLQNENHYTTVYDIYLMFHEALNYPDFHDMISKHTYYAEFTGIDNESRGVMWESTNHYFINQATPPADILVYGGKTGTTSEAGACLALYSKDKYGDPFITIILKAEDKETLYVEMNELLFKINK